MPSIWQAAAAPHRFRPLDEDTSVDVAIIGGGITGVLCADQLMRQGATVAVLEAHRIGGGSTGNSTGNLYALVGERYGRFDDGHATAVLNARGAAVDLIEQITREHAIDCDFVRCPWTMYAETEDGREAVDRGRELARLADLSIRTTPAPLPFAVKSSVTVEGQAQFNPFRFVQGLAERIAAAGGAVHEATRIVSLDGGRGVVSTDAADVRCKTIVMATHTPKGRLRLHAEMGVYREYGVAAPVDRAVVPPGIHWNAESPNRSIRAYSIGGRDYVVVVGENHRTGDREDTSACIDALERFVAALPGAGPVAYRWSAQNYRPADGLPFIGASVLGDNVLVATGYAADGLTYAGVAARMIADRLAGRAHPLADALDPRRLALGKELVGEAVNTLRQFARDLPGVATADPAAVGIARGAVVEHGGEKLALYRDSEGGVHCVSAVCTHMQCIVRWNDAERTWDCPCHGSRFDVDGRVLEGPALDDLPARPAPTR